MKMVCEKLKSVLIDVENGIYEVNGRSIASSCCELSLDFKNGEWSLALTEDSVYSTSESEVKE